jgi:hypothetical protein
MLDRNHLQLKPTNKIDASDLSLHSVATAKWHCHKLTDSAVRRSNAVEPELLRCDDVVLNGLLFREQLVASSLSLLGVVRRFSRDCIDAADV